MISWLKTGYRGWYLLGAWIITLLVSFQSYLLPYKSFDGTYEYPRYNNYVIFKNSFDHLVQNQNLYQLYPQEHWDLYKYSPTFAAEMAPFWFLPDLPGLILWNFINVWVLFWALSKIKFSSHKVRLLAHLFLLPEVFTSMQNSQSNLLIAGLIIIAYLLLEENKIGLACLSIMVAVFVKPFALAGFVVFIFYPHKGKMILFSILSAVVLFALPLLIISPQELTDQYKNWSILLQNDHSVSLGYSVMGWLQTWFNLEPDKKWLVISGAVLLLLPLLRKNLYTEFKFRLLMLASVLLWVILFNHKSESPTFIIAVSGIVLWYFIASAKTKLDVGLLIFSFVFTCLIATDIFPYSVRKEWAEPYAWKVFPCILVWLKIQWDLWKLKPVSAS